MPLAEGTCLGPYEIGAIIGAGGMGEVYRARDTRLKRDVAVKVLPFRIRFAPTRTVSRQQYVVRRNGEEFIAVTSDDVPAPISLLFNWRP